MAKLCEGFDKGRCTRPAIKSERFCPACRGMMMRKMKADGYFVQVPRDVPHDLPIEGFDDQPLGARGFSPEGPWDGHE